MRPYQGTLKSGQVLTASHQNRKEGIVYTNAYRCKTSNFTAAETSFPEKACERKLEKPLLTKGREKNVGFYQNMELG